MMAKRIHMIGIGGVGMAGLAMLLKRRGHQVSGCDLVATARTKWLEQNGIDFNVGHNASHLNSVDEVVITPAVHDDNVELSHANNVTVRGEMLARLVNTAADSIVVCGSHGKTTTATYIAKLLIALGENVEWCVGGETRNFPVAGCVCPKGNDIPPVLVCEGDESDGTLVDYQAKTLVITNVEYDHPDHFPTVDAYHACFNNARQKAIAVIEGFGSNREIAIAVALHRGHARVDIDRVIDEVTHVLPDRRFQEIEPNVIIDYAHHPTELRYAINNGRELMAQRFGKNVKDARLRVLFQPHRFSRTKSLKQDFASALALADEIILCPTYGAFEAPVLGGDVADLYAVMREQGANVLLAVSCEAAWTHAKRLQSAHTLTLVLGAGDIVDHLHELAPHKVWVGASSNTWKTDLQLPIEYVRTSGPANQSGSSLKIPWMAGIPGTIGGWVKMNAGAFGHSISEVIEAVKVDGCWRPAAECGFAYRHSNINGEIQDVRWSQTALQNAINSGNAAEYLGRRKHFPAGTYGSFFKNPPGDFAGRLLEAVGAKELHVGGAYVWAEHANVIVRGEDATGSDVLALARLMHQRVLERFGISLDPEVALVML